MDEEMSAYPDEIVVCHLPEGETDIWIRKNIIEVDNIYDDNSFKSYKATSAYMRISKNITKEDIENNLSYYWEMAKDWEPIINYYDEIDEKTKEYINKKISDAITSAIILAQGGSV